MKTSSKLLFFMMTILSTLMIMSSSNWFNLWMGLEINLMSFIPLMSEPKNSFLSETTMMYFMVQSLASVIMLMAILMNKMMLMNMMSKNHMNTLIQLSMMMKLGMPPLHMWYPEIMNKMKWNMCLMMSTWQKLGPMYILSKVLENNMMTMLMIMTSAMIGAICGLNQTSIRKILSYSSMNHMSWMIMMMNNSKQMWFMYMLVYMIMMTMTCLIMSEYNMLYINQIKTHSMNMEENMIMLILMMSLGGMPPLLGFIPKLMTINLMINMNEILTMIIMIMSSLITLSYYLKMSTSINLMMCSSQKWMNMTKKKKSLIMMTLFLNIMTPAMLMLMF